MSLQEELTIDQVLNMMCKAIADANKAGEDLSDSDDNKLLSEIKSMSLAYLEKRGNKA